MSYPRNAASPQRVSIGPVVQISDGSVQTSGVAVKVIPFGAAEASGTGTIAYSADGVVLYTPVQAETNYTSFVLVESKSGCIPASTTVVTSASATSGRVVLSSETHTGAVIPQVTLVNTCTTNSDMRGTDGALTTLGANAPAGWLNTAAFADGAITAGKFASGAFNAVWTVTTRGLTEAVVLDSGSLRSALGMSAADLDAQLDAILAAASAGAGTGARTVTITVNDGTTALQNAVVRLTEGSNTFRALTNASGVATFNLDDATYTVAVTKSGYTYAGTTLVVDGTETATYSMTAVSVTPPTNPDLSAIEVLCLDEDFAAASGIDVDFRMASVAAGDQNRAHPGAKKTVTSNGSGIARFEGPQGATIEWKRGTGQQWTPVTLDNDSVTNVTSLIGSP